LEIIKEKKITIIGYGSRIGVDSRILIWFYKYLCFI
jgi:ketol-acid reductoisomerase